MCGNSETVAIIKFFTLFADISNRIRSKFRISRWRDSKLIVLESQVDEFQKITVNLSRIYHDFQNSASKWHALCYLDEAIKRVDNLKYLDSGVFESFHKLFNMTSNPRNMFKEIFTAMEEKKETRV